MDIGLYREDEQFLFSTPYMDSYTYSSDSASFETLEQNELFEDLRPMPQPPSNIFEWHDDGEKESSYDTDSSPFTKENRIGETLCLPSESKEDLRKMLGFPDFQPVWQPILRSEPVIVGLIPNSDEEMAVNSHTNGACLPEVLGLPEIKLNGLNPLKCAKNFKIEAVYDCSISEYADSTLTESSSNGTQTSESSDLLNTSFSSDIADITNFDIAEYIFEENKQSKQSMHMPDPVGLNKDQGDEVNLPLNQKTLVKTENSIRGIKAAVKKLDLKAQKYIIDQKDIKSFSEDDDVDIETVSEEEGAPVLEAGNLTDLLEQFEANEVKNHKQNVNSLGDLQQQNLSLRVKVEVKTENEMLTSKPKVINTHIKEEPDNKIRNETKHEVEIKQEKLLKPASEKSIPGVKGHRDSTNRLNICKEQLLINNQKVVSCEPVVKPQEITASSKTPGISNNRHIIDSLPQELINRIKESGKRKPITVIQAIPNNRKRSKIQEPARPVVSSSSNTVHLDHNYCSTSSSSSNQINKKDSGFVSSEEDDRTIISRQPTVKNADGTLMVSLLKANTIRSVESSTNQKKKLNLEEYKKRRNGFLTPNSNSQSCSPNTSTCSSPLPEDDHQKMLKHQEKLRKMAEEVLNTAPKSEKKVENGPALLQIPTLIPLSPSGSTISSQSASPSKTEISNNVEIPVKIESDVKSQVPFKMEMVAEVKVPKIIELPKIPPNLERKVLVSFGVNTDFKIAKDEDPLAPVEQLEEIKILLEKASDKINENSLIASVIENIPKVIDKNDKACNLKSNSKEGYYEHGENKQVLYLEKSRVKCETKDAETQTNISLIEQSKRGRIRRRISSSSSCSSYKSKNSSRRSRKCSDSSSCSSSRSSGSSRRSISSSRSSDYSSRLSYSRSRSRSPRYHKRRRTSSAEREHLNAVEERRIIYVGRIAMATTKEDLKRKFQKFGQINKISLHFRDIGENYGFVTFKYKEDAHSAYEHGNDDPTYPYYKISFGGRREFCKAAYSDLDNMRDDSYQTHCAGDSYDKLLKEALDKLKKRKV